MPHSNASIVLDMDMLARVFNLNLFFAYEKVFGVLLWWGREILYQGTRVKIIVFNSHN